MSKTVKYTFLEAARVLLEEMKQPMHFKKITELAIQKKYLKSKGKTPEWTMGARLSVDIKEKGIRSQFARTGNGKYGLRKWRRAGKPDSIPVYSDKPDEKRFWLLAVEPQNFEHDVANNTVDVIGVRYRMRRTLTRLNPGDSVVVYMKKSATFSALLSVSGELYIEESDRWPINGKGLSARIEVSPVLILKRQDHIDARPLYAKLDVFTQYPEKHRTLALRNGITEISEKDFDIILNSMRT